MANHFSIFSTALSITKNNWVMPFRLPIRSLICFVMSFCMVSLIFKQAEMVFTTGGSRSYVMSVASSFLSYASFVILTGAIYNRIIKQKKKFNFKSIFIAFSIPFFLNVAFLTKNYLINFQTMDFFTGFFIYFLGLFIGFGYIFSVIRFFPWFVQSSSGDSTASFKNGWNTSNGYVIRIVSTIFVSYLFFAVSMLIISVPGVILLRTNRFPKYYDGFLKFPYQDPSSHALNFMKIDLIGSIGISLFFLFVMYFFASAMAILTIRLQNCQPQTIDDSIAHSPEPT